jgi:catechol 2,3-dioxygenase
VIAPETRVGAVHLTVADVERSRDFYREAIGLDVREEGGGRLSLGTADEELLVLVEARGARPAPRHTGRNHVALRGPDRVPLTGLSDHEVSEAIYLSDPDGHGIEIYADRPRERWEGRVMELMTTVPLDVDDLLGVLDDPASEPFDGLPRGTRMGHVHFQVADLAETVRFYRDALGFALTARLGDRAAFLSAGGYHHHVGANTWHSAGAGPPAPGSAALLHATVVLPDAAERDRLAEAAGGAEERDGGLLVRDPSGNALVLTTP